MKDTYKVVGLIDDNENKLNYAISGNKILGNRYDIPRICKENNVEVIFFTISNISDASFTSCNSPLKLVVFSLPKCDNKDTS